MILTIINDLIPLLESNFNYFDKTVRFRLVVFIAIGSVLYFHLLDNIPNININESFTDLVYYYSCVEVALNSISLIEG
ncbi:hypothetical protein WICPIJ_008718 [Wickerhamomyces pijperi]|uniref:Uncharacterized protein n=1 Tax=Wickerhamomyces pijperi TaxID=599730 RepID=A0A9P8PX14_WICPI|nr:hypothetical protein WICPIJ_008718 [Wickerhamomyces pijperi]